MSSITNILFQNNKSKAYKQPLSQADCCVLFDLNGIRRQQMAHRSLLMSKQPMTHEITLVNKTSDKTLRHLSRCSLVSHWTWGLADLRPCRQMEFSLNLKHFRSLRYRLVYI